METEKKMSFIKPTKTIAFMRRDSISEKIQTQLFENQTQKMRSKASLKKTDKNVLQSLPIIVKNYNGTRRLNSFSDIEPLPFKEEMTKSFTSNCFDSPMKNLKSKAFSKSSNTLNSCDLYSAEIKEQDKVINEQKSNIRIKSKIPTYNRNIPSNPQTSSLNRYYSVEELTDINKAQINIPIKQENQEKGLIKDKMSMQLDSAVTGHTFNLPDNLEAEQVKDEYLKNTFREINQDCNNEIEPEEDNILTITQAVTDNIIKTSQNCSNDQEISLEIRIELDSGSEDTMDYVNKILQQTKSQNYGLPDTKSISNNDSQDIKDHKVITKTRTHKSVKFSDIDDLQKINISADMVTKSNQSSESFRSSIINLKKRNVVKSLSSYDDPDPHVVEHYINSILMWSKFYCRLNPVDSKFSAPNLSNINGCWNIVEKKASLTTPEEFFICTTITDEDIFT